MNEKIVEEENERKLEKEKKYELVANRSQAEQKIRERLEKRKDEAEKEIRRREREEKRKLRKMSKKLNKLKEQEHEKNLREVGFTSLGDLGRLGVKFACLRRFLNFLTKFGKYCRKRKFGKFLIEKLVNFFSTNS